MSFSQFFSNFFSFAAKNLDKNALRLHTLEIGDARHFSASPTTRVVSRQLSNYCAIFSILDNKFFVFKMSSEKNKKKRTSIERPSSASSSVVEIPQIDPAEDSSSSDSDSDDDVQVPRSRTMSSSSSDDSEYDGMTAAEILATIKPSGPIPTYKGIPLQHRMTIKPENQRRIRRAGYLLDKNMFSFTESEDDQIRKNWAELAKNQQFDGHIFEFLGYDEHGLVQSNKYAKASSTVALRVMWPSLCKGLDRRSAQTVSMRISYIFHPHYREEQDYDQEEVEKRLDNDETPAEIAESLRIPPRFLEQKFLRNRKKVTETTVPHNQRVRMIKLLHESVIENGNNKFSLKNFDWKLFRNKCRENSLKPPTVKMVHQTLRTVFGKLEKEIFKHLDPPPTLKQKLGYFHETLQRFSMKEKTERKEKGNMVFRRKILLTVIFEDYIKREDWVPPPQFQTLANARKVDLDEVRSRVNVVKEHRKRLSESSPKARFHVIVKKRIKLEELEDEHFSTSMTREEERLEISSIHNESFSVAPSIVSSIDPFAYSEDDPLTELELSSINDTSSFATSRNETILAAGGGGIGNSMSNTSLGGLNETQPVEETVSLDLSQNIWSQLVGN